MWVCLTQHVGNLAKTHHRGGEVIGEEEFEVLVAPHREPARPLCPLVQPAFGRGLALTVLHLALTVLYLTLTILYLALTGLYLALTGLYVPGFEVLLEAHCEAARPL